MNNKEMLGVALDYELTEGQLIEEDQRRLTGTGLYADFDNIGGIVGCYGLDGLYCIVKYCEANSLTPVFIPEEEVYEGGAVVFKALQKDGE